MANKGDSPPPSPNQPSQPLAVKVDIAWRLLDAFYGSLKWELDADVELTEADLNYIAGQMLPSRFTLDEVHHMLHALKDDFLSMKAGRTGPSLVLEEPRVLQLAEALWDPTISPLTLLEEIAEKINHLDDDILWQELMPSLEEETEAISKLADLKEAYGQHTVERAVYWKLTGSTNMTDDETEAEKKEGDAMAEDKEEADVVVVSEWKNLKDEIEELVGKQEEVLAKSKTILEKVKFILEDF